MSDPALSPEARLDSLIADYLTRVEAGETIVADDFIATDPDLRQPFLEFIETSDSLDRLADQVPAQRPDASAVDTSRSGTLDETIAPTKQSTEKIDNSGIPKTFGRYEIKKLLGEGAMGSVYQAFDTQLHRLIALKVPKISDDDPELLARFYREARTAGGIRNANICPVYDVGDIDGQHYISMAYIEGKPLSAFIRPDKPIPVKSMAVIIRKLSIALQEAHALGVIHRDLKPDNIMIDKKHEPVIMDFGLARVDSPLTSARMTQSGMILGTPAYMSPEQVEASPDNIGAASDQYSMGVILYKMCAGQLPFRGSAAAVFGQIMTKEPEAPSDIRDGVPPKLEAICLKMMSKNIEDRYTDMQEVAEVLAEFLKNPGPKKKVVKPEAKPADSDAALPDKTSTQAAEEALVKTVVPEIPFDPSIETLRPGTAEAKPAEKPATRPKQKAASEGPPWWTNRLVQLGGLGGLVLLLGIVFFVRLGKYDVKITLDDPSITLSVDGKPLNDVLVIKDGISTIRLRAGEHKLVLEKDGLKTHVEEFTVTKDGKTALAVAIVNDKLDALLNGEKAPITSVASNAPMTEPPASAETHAGPTPIVESGGHVLSMSKDSYVSVPTLLLPTTGELTLEMVVHPTDHYSYRAALMGDPDSGSLNLDNGAAMGYFFHEDLLGDFPLELNQTYHIALVRSVPRGTKLFVDGKLVAHNKDETGLPETSPQPGSFRIGRRIHSSRSFVGQVNEVRVSTVARYQNDFIPLRRHKADAQTLALYHFDEGSGDVLKDSSGNGHDGKIVGAKWVSSSASSSGRFQNEQSVDLLTGAPPLAIAPFDGATAKRHQQAWAKHLGQPVEKDVELPGGVKLTLMLIPPGEFMMGFDRTDIKLSDLLGKEPGSEAAIGFEEALKSQKPQHRVRITRPFYLGKYEVTRAQWAALAGKEPSDNPDDRTSPAVRISWLDIQAALARLKSEDMEAAGRLRLPAEAQWEYACSAGSTDLYPWGGTDPFRPANLCWTVYNANRKPQPVGQFRPNAFGLYDMIGNVSEWCEDWHSDDYYGQSPVEDPSGPSSGTERTLRPSSCDTGLHHHTFSSARSKRTPDSRIPALGFRLVMTIDTAKPSPTAGVPIGGAKWGTSHPGNPSVPPASQSKRVEAAKAVLAAGGQLRISLDGKEQPLSDPSDVPDASFKVLNVKSTTGLIDQWMTLSDMTHLTLSASLAEKDAEKLSALPLLESLTLQDFEVTNSDLHGLHGCHQLTHLKLDYLKVKEPIELPVLPALEKLVFAGGNGQHVSSLGNQPNLRSLMLFALPINDEGLNFTTLPPRLETVSIDKCGELTDKCLTYIGKIKSLKKLAVVNTKITRSGMEGVQKLLDSQCEISWGETYDTREALPLLPKTAMPAGTSNSFELDFIDHTYVEVPTFKLNRKGPITIEAFVTWERSLSTVMLAGGDGGFGLKVASRDHSLVGWDADKENYAALKKLRSVERLHFAGVYTGTKILAFVDGKLVTTIDNPNVQMSDSPFKMGENYIGKLGPVRVSSVARYTTDFTPSQQMQTDKDTLALYKFQEGSGDVLKDSSGNGHHGKISGAKWVSSAKTADLLPPTQIGPDAATSGYALQLRGPKGYVEMPIPAYDFSNREMTIEGIINPQDHHGEFHRHPDGRFAGRVIIVGDDKARLDLSFQGGRWEGEFRANPMSRYKIKSSDVNVPEKFKPMHVAVVYSGGKVTLFLDGKLVTKKGYANKSGYRKIKTGATLGLEKLHNNAFGEEFHGTIREVRFSTIARYKASYTPKSRLESDEHTLALYHFDEGSGNVLKDSSGNGYHGKIIGAKWVGGPKTTDVLPPTQKSPDAATSRYALQLRGGKGYVEMPIPAYDFSNREMTIEGIINPQASLDEFGTAHAGRAIVFGNKKERLDLSFQYGCWVSQFRVSPRSRYTIRSTDIRMTDVNVSKRLKPMHVAAVYSARKVTLFLDGKLVTEKGNHTKYDYRGVVGGATFGLEKITDGNLFGEEFHGTIREVRFSTVARYKASYTPKDRLESDEHTLALYHFDEGSGDVLKDSSGNGYHGKIIGAKWVSQDSGKLSSTEQAEEFPGGLEFDGDDVVNIDSLEFDPRHSFTVEAAYSWKCVPRVTDHAIFAGHGGGDGLKLRLESYNHLILGVRDVTIDLGTIPETQERGHLAIVHTGEELLGFRNGKLLSRKTTTGKDLGPGTGQFLIGRKLVGRYEMFRFSTTARYAKDFPPKLTLLPISRPSPCTTSTRAAATS